MRWLLLTLFLLLYYFGDSSRAFSIHRPAASSSSSSSSLAMSVLPSSAQSSVVSASELLNDDDDNNKDYYYVFWLMPVKRDAQLLRHTIMRDLRQEFIHAVDFEPHVTLAPPVPASAIPDPDVALARLASAFTTIDENNNSNHLPNTSNLRSRATTPPLQGNPDKEDSTSQRTILTLSGARANYGTRYTQSIFLQLEATPVLRDLYNTARQVSGLPPTQVIPAADHFPHLSVLYESCCEMTRAAAAARVEQRLRTVSLSQQISFDAVQLIRIQLPVEGPDDVRLWKSLGTAPLLR